MPKHDVFQKPLGIGYFSALKDEQGGAEDYVLPDADSGFMALLGGVSTGAFPWRALFQQVLRSGKTGETALPPGPDGQALILTAVPMGPGQIMAIVRAGCAQPATAGDEVARVLEGLENVFANAHDAVSLLAYEGEALHYVRNNAVHQAFTGYYHIEGRSLDEVVGEETGKRLRQYYQECIRTGHPVRYEQQFDFTPGTRIWQTEVTLVFSGGGTHYLLCFSRDVTELKQVRREKEELVRRLEAMYDQHSAIQMIFNADTGRIVDVNPAACGFYGYPREEFLSMNIQDINTISIDLPRENLQSEKFGGAVFTALPQRMKSGEIRLLDIYSCPIWVGGCKFRYSIVIDATEREGYRSALMHEKELLEVTLQSIGDGVVTTDSGGLITSMNKVALALTGWEGTAAVGRPFEEVFVLRNEETGLPVESPVHKVLDTGLVVGLANHTELVTRRGDAIPIADSAAPIRTEDGKDHGVVMVFRDVSAEREHAQEIKFLSYHDALTGLYNRRGMEKAMEQLDRPEYLPITIIMGDVNGLKITNDVFGHEAGDALLQNVARLLRAACGERAILSRWGGDEFVVLLTGTGVRTGEEMIGKIRAEHISIQKSDLYLSISLGCAGKTEEGEDLRATLKAAEEYMYHQKLLAGKSYRNAIINTLLATLYEESNETEAHSKRLEEFCLPVGQELRLSTKEMDELSLLALLHDVGKVSISSDILRKPGALTPEEWVEMKRHPEIGYRIAQATPELFGVSELILAHHERWDGMGYPRGLKGEEIPLTCRILALADAFDAMTSDRVYRRAMGEAEALSEIARNAGSQFDPQIAHLFVQAMRGRSERCE